MNYREFLLEEARRTSDTLEIVKRKLEVDTDLPPITEAEIVIERWFLKKHVLYLKVARLGVKILNVLLWFRK